MTGLPFKIFGLRQTASDVLRERLPRPDGIWIALGLMAAGLMFSWRLTSIPSRLETTVIVSSIVMMVSLVYPRFTLYYLLTIPCFVPLFRRLYYLLDERPKVDFLMLMTDGAVLSIFAAVLMLHVKNKIVTRDRLSWLLFSFIVLMVIKIFVISTAPMTDAMYAFKFYGLYILVYYFGSSLSEDSKDIIRFIGFISFILSITAVYSIKQVLFGYAGFEQLWLNSIEFTTLYIEGKVRTFSTLASPATLSDAMSLLLVFAMYFLLSSRMTVRLAGIATLFLAVPPLLFSTVRTNWIASFFALWFYLVFLRRISIKLTIFNLILLGAALFFTMNYGSYHTESQSQALEHNLIGNESKSLTELMVTNRVDALANPLQEYSMQKRFETWLSIFYEVRYTFPLGKGLGAASYAHSFYFQVLGELGFPGFILLVIILYVIFKRGILLIRRSEDPEVQELGRVLLTVITLVSILNLTGLHLNSHPTDIIFWFCSGWVSLLYHQYVPQHETAPKKSPADAGQETD